MTGLFDAEIVSIHGDGTPKLAAKGPLWAIENDAVIPLRAYYVTRSPTGLPAVVASDARLFVWGTNVFLTEAEALAELMWWIDAKRRYLELRAKETEARLRDVSRG